jgi:hypothetical protein
MYGSTFTVLHVKCIADTRYDKIIESTHLTVPTSHLHYAYSLNVAMPDALCHDKVRHALYIIRHALFIRHAR